MTARRSPRTHQGVVGLGRHGARRLSARTRCAELSSMTQEVELAEIHETDCRVSCRSSPRAAAKHEQHDARSVALRVGGARNANGRGISTTTGSCSLLRPRLSTSRTKVGSCGSDGIRCTIRDSVSLCASSSRSSIRLKHFALAATPCRAPAYHPLTGQLSLHAERTGRACERSQRFMV